MQSNLLNRTNIGSNINALLPNASSLINLAFTTFWAQQLSEKLFNQGSFKLSEPFSDIFWKRSGALQRYANFLLCETDPLFNQQRLAAQIIRVESETTEATTLWLRPSSRWSGFRAGQFITIDCEINGVRLKRNYSISCAPEVFEQQGLISITVKAIDDGRVSNFINDSLTESQIVHISEAMGSFTLPFQADQETQIDKEEQNPVALDPMLFVAAGSGVTPIKSMIEHYVNQVESGYFVPQSVQLVYYSNTHEDGIFIDQLQALAERYDYLSVVHRVTDRDGLINQASLKQDCQDIDERSIYLCGPAGFMSAVEDICSALNIASDQIQMESFGAAPTSLTAVANLDYDFEATPVSVDFAFADQQVTSSSPKSLLELAESAGLTPKYGCRAGICHECKCQRPKGPLVNQLTGDLIPDDQTVVQSCITAPIGNVTLEQW